jgi:hypothetical protein
LKQAEIYFEDLKKCESSEENKDALLLCELSHSIQKMDYARATQVQGMIEKRYENLTDFNAISFIVDVFDLNIKMNQLEEAKITLMRTKKHRNFFNSANYKFMKALLYNLTDHEPIYVYDRDFDSNNVIFHQLKVISALEGNNITEAQASWNKLSNVAPEIYRADFRYEGDKCLFSLALEKYSVSLRDPIVREITGKTNLEKLASILQDAKAPIRKELLYELIWGETAETKDDYRKLTKMLSVWQKKNNKVVRFSKGCYQLVSEEGEESLPLPKKSFKHS